MVQFRSLQGLLFPLHDKYLMSTSLKLSSSFSSADNERRTFSEHEKLQSVMPWLLFLRQICFYFLSVNEIKAEHSSHNQLCSRPECQCWISSFSWSKHPGDRGYMAWIDWQSSITRAYQSPVCNYLGSVWWWDLICTRIIVTGMCAKGALLHIVTLL